VTSQVGYGSKAIELEPPHLALFSYNLWNSLFYGGLLVAGYVLSVRGERTRVLLREAAIARGRTEALLGELQLQMLQAQIDPTLLLAALDEVQSRLRCCSAALDPQRPVAPPKCWRQSRHSLSIRAEHSRSGTRRGCAAVAGLGVCS